MPGQLTKEQKKLVVATHQSVIAEIGDRLATKLISNALIWMMDNWGNIKGLSWSDIVKAVMAVLGIR
jgi:hypothetical protein